jgi:dienelactone hydrolase
MKRRSPGIALALALATGMASAQVEVAVPSLDVSRGPGLMLKGWWFPVPATTPAPAVVLLHGCSGAYDRRGALSRHLRDYAGLLNARGMHALVVDSLTPRGETQICTQKVRVRLITQAHRRLDALSALEWLAARSDVDPARLGFMGWSNGGSTVLAATNERHTDAVGGDDRRPAFGVAFYPGCDAELRRGYETQSRVLLLLGEADDWTPAATCKRLVAQAAGRKPEIESYPGAGHGFDTTAPVRVRTDVRAGQGVHVGGDPKALARSRARLEHFLDEVAAAPAPAASAPAQR